VNQKADYFLHWALKYGSLTHDWRRDVVTKLNEVSGAVGEDLQMLVAGGKAFKLTLDNAEDYEKKLLDKKLAEEVKTEQSNIDGASQTAAVAINRALDVMKRSGEDEFIATKMNDAYGTVHPHTVENATDVIDTLLLRLGDTKTAEAVRTYLALAAKKSADITGAREKLQDKFDQLQAAVAEALPHGSSFAALKENAALLEEQRALSNRMTHLTEIMGSATQNHDQMAGMGMAANATLPEQYKWQRHDFDDRHDKALARVLFKAAAFYGMRGMNRTSTRTSSDTR